nr:STM4015 family protein [Nocardiopsis listeri]
MFFEHLTEFGGLPVFDYASPEELSSSTPRYEQDQVDADAQNAALRTPDAYAWRFQVESFDPEEEFADHFGSFVAATDTSAVKAIVIGAAGDSELDEPGAPARDALLEHADRFTGLRSLFIGDLISEEAELSWIHQPDLAPVLAAYPNLTEFAVRGTGDPYLNPGSHLGLDIGRHDALRTLTVQTGGLPARVARGIDGSDLPELEHLELWLGVGQYRGDTYPQDLSRTLSGEAFPRLLHLGLRNAENTDLWVRALAEAPVVGRLRSLDLSMGTLTDEGAEVLMGAPAFRDLARLDLSHHYMSEDMERRVREVFAEADVDLSAQERQVEENDWRFPSATE